jgi:type IV secretion system protein VirB10
MSSSNAPERDDGADTAQPVQQVRNMNAAPDAPLNAPQVDARSDTRSEMPNELGIPGLQLKASNTRDWKPLLAGGLMVASVIGSLGYAAWSRFGPQPATAAPPMAVASDQLPPIRFDEVRQPAASATGTTASTHVPAIAPLNGAAPADGSVPPIGLQRPGQGPMPAAGSAAATAGASVPSIQAGVSPGTAPRAPRDESPFISSAIAGSVQAGAGPSMQRVVHGSAVSQNNGQPLNAATANLEQYQSQLDGMVRQLQNLTDQAQGVGTPGAVPAAMPANPALMQSAPQVATAKTPALFGQLERSQTPRAQATMLGARSTIVPKGVLFQCALKTRIVSAVSGFVGCQVQRPVYSDDGKVVLIERGSHLDGEYRIVQVRPGVTRIPILWTRVRTPHGVTVDLDSPATGPLGDSGISGEIDNRWVERIGAALLLSLIDDAIKLQISENTSNPNATVVMPNTAATTSRLAEKVLDSTINIPPLITAHQGSVVGVYVSRDLDFSGVYRLEPR